MTGFSSGKNSSTALPLEGAFQLLVIPAKAGIHFHADAERAPMLVRAFRHRQALDSRFRGNDRLKCAGMTGKSVRG
jgi:hypothetical protein